MATSGQTLNDRINAARYALAGQGLARCVCKATTEEVIGPKKKHLDYLLACTHEPNVSIPQLANLLIERTNHIYWVVVFKALVTVHHLMSYGNERFIQYLASSNYSFELSTFLDKTAARDFSMSTFIRRYSRYINEKALSYRLLAFDFCKVKRGNEGVLRLMSVDRLLNTLPILQNQLDALLEFDCSASDLNNGVINACFMLLFRDLIGLFACHNDGIINLLNKYFTLNKKVCREALDMYKKFLVRMDKVSDFLRVAEVVGIDKDEIPDLRRAPSSLIDALEQHLQNLESNKKILKTNRAASEFNSAISSITPPNQAKQSTSKEANVAEDASISSFGDDEVRKALEEEARVLSQYGTTGESKLKSRSSTTSIKETSLKFSVTTTPKTIEDIFGDADSFAISNNNNSSNNNKNSSNGHDSAAFDNLSNTSSSSSTANSKPSRPDANSIKSAIKSATTALEKANSNKASGSESGRAVASQKASDELFSLLESPTSSSNFPNVPATQSSASIILGSAQNQTSPFGSSPFDLPSNGHVPVSSAPLKPGNPFPEAVSSFDTGFQNITQKIGPMNNNVFVSSTRTGPNYTNLGGLEGFGDVLQPMSSSGKTQSNMVGSSGSAGTKQAFGAPTGVLSTGLFKGDLDSTLANLAQNLTFDGINKTKK